MFSGLVEAIGYVRQVQEDGICRHFSIVSQRILDDIKTGDSISVNGVCLTITSFSHDAFNVTAVPETLKRTNLGELKKESPVNLERSIQASSRISGHYVQGHVDGKGEILALDGKEDFLAKIGCSSSLSKYLVNKGYVAIDGMSITLIDVTREHFTVTFIPHTQDVTIVSQYQIGTLVNIEVDILGKYIEKLLRPYEHSY